MNDIQARYATLKETYDQAKQAGDWNAVEATCSPPRRISSPGRSITWSDADTVRSISSSYVITGCVSPITF